MRRLLEELREMWSDRGIELDAGGRRLAFSPAPNTRPISIVSRMSDRPVFPSGARNTGNHCLSPTGDAW